MQDKTRCSSNALLRPAPQAAPRATQDGARKAEGRLHYGVLMIRLDCYVPLNGVARSFHRSPAGGIGRACFAKKRQIKSSFHKTNCVAVLP